jgi:hypothetical protein
LEPPKDATPVTLATLYNPRDKSEKVKTNMIILCDSGSSGSMVKGEIVQDFLEEFGTKQNIEYLTAAGSLSSTAKIPLQISLDEFGGATKYYMISTWTRIQKESAMT